MGISETVVENSIVLTSFTTRPMPALEMEHVFLQTPVLAKMDTMEKIVKLIDATMFQ